MKKIRLLSYTWLIIAIWLTGCAQIAPAQLPPRLMNQTQNRLPTLVAPFKITARTYTNSAFSVSYPYGWRVVSSAEFAPPSAVFVSPDEIAIIYISPKADTIPPMPHAGLSYDQIQTQIGEIWVIGIAPSADWDTFLPIYQQMLRALVVLDS